MSKSTAVEEVEPGDRIELWVRDAPQVVVVNAITDGAAFRTLTVNHPDGPFDLFVQRGHEVNLVC